MEACQRHYSQKHTYTAATTCIDSAKISAEQQGRVVAVLSTNCRHCSSVHSRYCTTASVLPQAAAASRPDRFLPSTGFFRRPLVYKPTELLTLTFAFSPQNHRTLRFPPQLRNDPVPNSGAAGKFRYTHSYRGAKKRDRKRVHKPKAFNCKLVASEPFGEVHHAHTNPRSAFLACAREPCIRRRLGPPHEVLLLAWQRDSTPKQTQNRLSSISCDPGTSPQDPRRLPPQDSIASMEGDQQLLQNQGFSHPPRCFSPARLARNLVVFPSAVLSAVLCGPADRAENKAVRVLDRTQQAGMQTRISL